MKIKICCESLKGLLRTGHVKFGEDIRDAQANGLSLFLDTPADSETLKLGYCLYCGAQIEVE